MVASITNVNIRSVRIGQNVAPPPAAFIQDSFTGTNGTFLINHTPEIGGPWVMPYEDPETMVIEGNKLRRPYDTGFSYGQAGSYSDTIIPTNTFQIEIDIIFDPVDPDVYQFASFELARLGSNYGNSDKFLVIEWYQNNDQFIYFGDPDFDYYNNGFPYTGFIAGVTYTLKVELTSTTMNLYVNNVQIGGAITGIDWFDGPLALVIRDQDGYSLVGLDNLNVEGFTPPTPPIQTEIVLDTFTGPNTDTLATHVGEVGATWLTSSAFDNFFGSQTGGLEGYLLTGSGSIVPDYGNPQLVYPSGSAVLGDTFTLELDFEFSDVAGPYTGFTGNTSTGEAYIMNWFVTNSYFEIDFYYVDSGGGSDTLGYLYLDDPIQGTGQHTLKIVSTPTTKYVYLDNVFQFQFTDSRVTSGVAFLSLYDCFNGTFSRIRITE